MVPDILFFNTPQQPTTFPTLVVNDPYWMIDLRAIIPNWNDPASEANNGTNVRNYLAGLSTPIVLKFPVGTTYIDHLTIQDLPHKLIGSSGRGQAGSTIPYVTAPSRIKSSYNGRVLLVTNTTLPASSGSQFAEVSDIGIEGDITKASQDLFTIDNQGIIVSNVECGASGRYGFVVTFCEGGRFDNCSAHHCVDNGWQIAPMLAVNVAGHGGDLTATTFIDCLSVSNGGHGVALRAGSDGAGNHNINSLTWIGGYITLNTGVGISCSSTGSGTIQHNRFLDVHDETNTGGTVSGDGSTQQNRFDFNRYSSGQPVFSNGTQNAFSGTDLSANVNPRTDTNCATTSGSNVVTDAAILATDVGTTVTGTGIPASTYVGTVTPGVSFLLSSNPTKQVNVNATATTNPVSLTIGNPHQARQKNGFLDILSSGGYTSGDLDTLRFRNKSDTGGGSVFLASMMVGFALQNPAGTLVSTLPVPQNTDAINIVNNRGLTWRNAANTANIQGFYVTSNDDCYVGPGLAAGKSVYIGGTLQLNAHDVASDTTTGSKIGTTGGASGQKLGFFGASPIVQPLLATGAGHTVDDIITTLQTLGLVRQS